MAQVSDLVYTEASLHYVVDEEDEEATMRAFEEDLRYYAGAVEGSFGSPEADKAALDALVDLLASHRDPQMERLADDFARQVLAEEEEEEITFIKAQLQEQQQAVSDSTGANGNVLHPVNGSRLSNGDAPVQYPRLSEEVRRRMDYERTRRDEQLRKMKARQRPHQSQTAMAARQMMTKEAELEEAKKLADEPARRSTKEELEKELEEVRALMKNNNPPRRASGDVNDSKLGTGRVVNENVNGRGQLREDGRGESILDGWSKKRAEAQNGEGGRTESNGGRGGNEKRKVNRTGAQKRRAKQLQAKKLEAKSALGDEFAHWLDDATTASAKDGGEKQRQESNEPKDVPANTPPVEKEAAGAAQEKLGKNRRKKSRKKQPPGTTTLPGTSEENNRGEAIPAKRDTSPGVAPPAEGHEAECQSSAPQALPLASGAGSLDVTPTEVAASSARPAQRASIRKKDEKNE